MPQRSLATRIIYGSMQHVTWIRLDSWPSNHHIVVIGYSPCQCQCVDFVWVMKQYELQSALGLVLIFVNPTSACVELMLMRMDCTVFPANLAPVSRQDTNSSMISFDRHSSELTFLLPRGLPVMFEGMESVQMASHWCHARWMLSYMGRYDRWYIGRLLSSN